MKKKILFIVNPRAGVERLKAVEDAVVKHLDHDIFTWRIAHTEYPRHGTDLAKQAVEDHYDCVVAVGGDGSLNDIIQGLKGTETALGVIPMGSGNGLARSAGLPLKLNQAIKVLNKQNIHAIDMGQVDGERLFISNAGVGFDSLVTKLFAKSQIRGFKTYIKIITQNIWRYKSRTWQIELDGQIVEQKAFMITVANATQLGYNFQIAPTAQLNDGYFDVVIIQSHPKILTGIIGLQAFTDTLLHNRYVKHYRAKSVKLYNPDNKIMQVDGDAIPCQNHIEINILEKAIRLYCP